MEEKKRGKIGGGERRTGRKEQQRLRKSQLFFFFFFRGLGIGDEKKKKGCRTLCVGMGENGGQKKKNPKNKK